MKIKKILFICGLIVMAIGTGWVIRNKPTTMQEVIHTENLGDVAVAHPLWGAEGLILVFVDTNKFPAIALAQRLAATGVTAAIVDSVRFFNRFNAASGQCLDDRRVAAAINELLKKSPVKRLIVAGLAEGALVPFINAQSASVSGTANLSVGFSVDLPVDLALCPPLLSQYRQQKPILVSSPALKGFWRSVWTDQPAAETAVFIKSLGNVDTRIAAYDTAPDTLLIEELNTALGKNKQSSPPMPVVEVPVAKPGYNVTLFYSGDGGWRDLDRTVAGEMAALNYPVVGVDVLRYFWEHKSPEQASADLATTMAYYRKNWAVKSFVLAGYSFGADILPALYNRLSQQDKDSVALLALIALANSADFEIHVSGWLGQSAGEKSLAPELAQIPKNKILCIYGKDEKAETACTGLLNTEAKILELPGGHHFDQDYPKLTRQILDVYRQHGIN